MGSRKTDEELRAAGVVRVRRKRDTEPELRGRIRDASDIFFLGFSLTTQQTHAFVELLEEKAHLGHRVRLLVLDPCKKELVSAVEESLSREVLYPRELSTFLEIFLRVWERVPDNLEVRVHNRLPCFSASIFNGKEGSVDIPVFGHEGYKQDERLVVELDYEGNAEDIKRSLESLWENATRLDSREKFRERINIVDRIAQERLDGSL